PIPLSFPPLPYTTLFRSDIAIADSFCFRKFFNPILHIERMHLERRHVNKKARPNELLVLVVFAQYVTDVLTQETFNAFSKFLDRSEEHTSELQSPDHLVC